MKRIEHVVDHITNLNCPCTLFTKVMSHCECGTSFQKRT